MTKDNIPIVDRKSHKYISLIGFLIILSLFPALIICDATAQTISFNKMFHGWSATANLNYVSSATVQLNPYSADIAERNSTVEVNGGYGYGFSVRKNFSGKSPGSLYFVLSTEYVKFRDDQLFQYLQNDTAFLKVRATETISLIPVEGSVMYQITNISEGLRLYFGGGIGVYFGDRVRKIIGLESETKSTTPLLDFHVLFGMEYFLEERLSAIFEAKFREADFKVRSSYPADSFIANGRIYYFDKEINSKVYVDGIKLSLGIGYYF